MPWDKYNEAFLKRHSKKCKIHSLMHSLTANYYSNLNTYFGIPVVLLGAITSASIFSSANSTNTDDGTLIYRNYINGSLALIVTALGG